MKTPPNRIKCPECQVNTMRRAHGINMIFKEYFCDNCHQYFGIHALVTKYSYDLGDFYSKVTKNTQLSTPEFSCLLDYAGRNIPIPILSTSPKPNLPKVWVDWFEDYKVDYGCQNWLGN